MKTTNGQTLERVTVNRVKIDSEIIALDVVRRGEKIFVFEIMRDNGNRMVASSDEHKKAKRAARAGKPIWKRTVKAETLIGADVQHQGEADLFPRKGCELWASLWQEA